MRKPPHLREVVYEDMASDAIDWLSKRFPRFRDLLESWEFRLSRAPAYRAEIVPGTSPPLYLIKTPQWFDLPQLTFYYRFDDQVVTVRAIRAIEPLSPGEM